jgi:hypothetical protein
VSAIGSAWPGKLDEPEPPIGAVIMICWALVNGALEWLTCSP